MMDARTGRSIQRMLLTAWAVVIVSWLALAALAALSILWPANPVPQVLLGLSVCAVVARVAWPGQPGRARGRVFWRILFAPRDLLLSVAGAVRLRRRTGA